MRGPGLALALGLMLSGPLAAADTPRSAIPWLSESLTAGPDPLAGIPDISAGDGRNGISPFAGDQIMTSSLDQPVRDGLGTIPPGESGLPADLWGNTSALRVRAMIASHEPSGVPAARDLFRTLLLSETTPPPGSGPGNAVLLARIDALMAAGFLSEARDLLSLAGPNDPRLFRRHFDIALLTGGETAACEELRALPALSPTLPARVYCLALLGDWNAAALTLNLGRDVGQITDLEEEHLAWFLDPAAFEGTPPPAIPKPLTTLDFILREAVALPRPDGALPLAFLFADAGEEDPWRTRILAREELVKNGAMPPSDLWAAYRTGAPSASGGVWDRVAAVQGLDDALAIQDPDGIAEALVTADSLLSAHGLRKPLARQYARQIAVLDPADFPAGAKQTAFALLMLADRIPEAEAWLPEDGDPVNRFFAMLASGGVEFPVSDALSPLKAAVASGLTSEVPPEQAAFLVNMHDRGAVGEALLRTLDLLSAGPEIDPGDLEAALYYLRHAGLDEAAWQIATETLLLLPEA